jgi:signal transduction histidine kinase
MKLLLKIIWLSCFPLAVIGQYSAKDSLLFIINEHKRDTVEVNTLVYLAREEYFEKHFDSARHYLEMAKELSSELGYNKGNAHCLIVESDMNAFNGNFAEAIEDGLGALAIYKKINDPVGIASASLVLQGNYWYVGEYRTALTYSIPGEQIAKENNVKGFLVFPGNHLAPLFASEIAQVYIFMDKLDSALYWVQRSIDQKEPFKGTEWNFPIYVRATIQTMRGEYADALVNFRKAYPLAISNGVPRDTLQIFAGMSTLFRRMGQYDSSLHYGKMVVTGWSSESEYKNLAEVLDNLGQIYKLNGKADSALKYVELAQATKDSIFNTEKNREIQRVTFADKVQQQQLVAEQLKYKNEVQLYSFIGGALILVVIALILWRSSQQQRNAKTKIQNAYTELKSTQAQLIQSEKMASLGELTAGIAHEIENPLNFVNNFSEVSNELIGEMKAELSKGNTQEANEIADDLKQNLEKINHHGKRADAIVKGMLQHSRASSGQKELTDINALCDEYLRLAYHGMRAKDPRDAANKSFNAKLETDLDPSVGKINIIPQDIGRVILNLINNAFYAVNERWKPARAGTDGAEGERSKAMVSVSTKNLDGKILICVKDNGNGIPQNIRDKIFQPFFTTKPTGQGTGLGLSLSYDIIKAHGGEIKVETREGEGSEFIIQLPQG